MKNASVAMYPHSSENVPTKIPTRATGFNSTLMDQLKQEVAYFQRLLISDWTLLEVLVRADGGGRGIRTPEPLSRLTVFKTAGFNHSPIPPWFFLSYLISLLRVHRLVIRTSGSMEK
jgi:hypothetical protein